eukprot:CAMPEP_0117073084 /NCGR_PEP_ID=MMETSP0472-20121206/51465_1 /TAXON_ID=693140 ORGANISM="Tiarina fusus, Strain LIS" /NCGR_SAMPLE_ID=MMETSP0472 /ASSEMBLY_ACC=CAM_ASM_000603 /LENGTH=42 /DNA_ID= /DNA_START= /DNA_END= /DNA_ORIENTATION=
MSPTPVITEPPIESNGTAAPTVPSSDGASTTRPSANMTEAPV